MKPNKLHAVKYPFSNAITVVHTETSPISIVYYAGTQEQYDGIFVGRA